MADETPVLDALAGMTAASLARDSLPARKLMLVRIAALVAAGAAATDVAGEWLSLVRCLTSPRDRDASTR